MARSGVATKKNENKNCYYSFRMSRRPGIWGHGSRKTSQNVSQIAIPSCPVWFVFFSVEYKQTLGRGPPLNIVLNLAKPESRRLTAKITFSPPAFSK